MNFDQSKRAQGDEIRRATKLHKILMIMWKNKVEFNAFCTSVSTANMTSCCSLRKLRLSSR